MIVNIVWFSGEIEMLTPKFELTQTETKVCIIVFAPYTNISETEIYVEKNDFRFFSPPYYLRYVEYMQNIHIYHVSDVLYFMNLSSVQIVLWNLKCHM
jgi:hypothetical protein